MRKILSYIVKSILRDDRKEIYMKLSNGRITVRKYKSKMKHCKTDTKKFLEVNVKNYGKKQ